MEYKQQSLVVISFVMETENYQVYVKYPEDQRSSAFDFLGEPLDLWTAQKSGKELILDIQELIDSTIHEIQIAHRPNQTQPYRARSGWA